MAKKRKPEFKDRYGDRWEEVLYATAWKQHKNESVNEMFSIGAAGYKVFYVDEKVYRALQGTFPDAHTTFDPADEIATVNFSDPVDKEIERKMDYFNSNWQTRTIALRGENESLGEAWDEKTERPKSDRGKFKGKTKAE